MVLLDTPSQHVGSILRRFVDCPCALPQALPEHCRATLYTFDVLSKRYEAALC